MTLYLGCGIEAEPYTIGDEIWETGLGEAISEEAAKIASAAGSDLLEEDTPQCRDLLQAQIERDMGRALQAPGDTYKDPTGVTYWLYEKQDQPQPQQEV